MISLLLVLFVSCVPEEHLEYEYSDGYHMEIEPMGFRYFINGKTREACVNGHNYVFEFVVSEKTCNEFILENEKLCDFLGNNGISTEGLTFFILDDYQNRSDSENSTSYIDISTERTWKHILTVIQTALGDYTNYGYLYALSNFTAEKLGWEKEQTMSFDNNIFVNNPDLFNLVYTCFCEPYSSIDEITACKALSVEILKEIDNPYSGENDFTVLLPKYAKDMGIEFNPTYIVFAYNGESCPLKFRSKYFEVFRDVTYIQSRHVGQMMDEDHLKSIKTIINSYEAFDSYINPLVEKFNLNELEPLPVILMNEIPQKYGTSGGVFVSHEGKIFARGSNCIIHEYTHYIYYLLTEGYNEGYEMWLDEAFTRYFTYHAQYEFYVKFFEYQKGNAYLEEACNLIGQDFDEPYDYILYNKALHKRELDYERGITWQYYLKTNMTCGDVFGVYFVETYGEKAFINSMLFPQNIKKYTGKTMDEIIYDWTLTC